MGHSEDGGRQLRTDQRRSGPLAVSPIAPSSISPGPSVGVLDERDLSVGQVLVRSVGDSENGPVVDADRTSQGDVLVYDVVNPIIDAFLNEPTVAAMKHPVRTRGHEVGLPLLPLPTLSGEDRERLDRRYEKALEASVVG